VAGKPMTAGAAGARTGALRGRTGARRVSGCVPTPHGPEEKGGRLLSLRTSWVSVWRSASTAASRRSAASRFASSSRAAACCAASTCFPSPALVSSDALAWRNSSADRAPLDLSAPRRASAAVSCCLLPANDDNDDAMAPAVTVSVHGDASAGQGHTLCVGLGVVLGTNQDMQLLLHRVPPLHCWVAASAAMPPPHHMPPPPPRRPCIECTDAQAQQAQAEQWIYDTDSRKQWAERNQLACCWQRLPRC
jgi:hypothetical protein